MPAIHRFEPPWVHVPAGTAVAFRTTCHARHSVTVTTGRAGEMVFRESNEHVCVYTHRPESATDADGVAAA